MTTCVINGMVTAGLSEELEQRIATVIRAAPINSSKSCCCL